MMNKRVYILIGLNIVLAFCTACGKFMIKDTPIRIQKECDIADLSSQRYVEPDRTNSRISESETEKGINASSSTCVPNDMTERESNKTPECKNNQMQKSSGGADDKNTKYDMAYVFSSGIPKPGNDFYLLEDSDKKRILYQDIEDFNADKLDMAKNEIYARNGYISKDGIIQSYFGCQKWYEPKTDDIDEIKLNAYEAENISMLEQLQSLSNDDDNSKRQDEFREIKPGRDYRIEYVDPYECCLYVDKDKNRYKVIINTIMHEFNVEKLSQLKIYELISDGIIYLLFSGNMDDLDGMEVMIFKVSDERLALIGTVGGEIESIFDNQFGVEKCYEFTLVSEYSWYRLENGELKECGERLLTDGSGIESGYTIQHTVPGYKEENGKIIKTVINTGDRFKLLSVDMRGVTNEDRKTQYWKLSINDSSIVYVPAYYNNKDGFGDMYCEDGIELESHYDYTEFYSWRERLFYSEGTN